MVYQMEEERGSDGLECSAGHRHLQPQHPALDQIKVKGEASLFFKNSSNDPSYGRVVENRNVEGWRVGCNFIITSWRVIIPNPPQDDRFVR